MTEFLHGVQVVNIDTGARSIAVASTSVIGIVGKDGGYTATQADACVIIPTATPLVLAA